MGCASIKVRTSVQGSSRSPSTAHQKRRTERGTLPGNGFVTKANELTSVFVKQCRQAGVYRDGQGLMLRVEPTGTKRWVLRITVRGMRRDVGIGSAKDVSLVEARNRAFELRRLAREGKDVVGAQRAARTSVPTFKDAAKTVHLQRIKGWSNGKHRNQWINTLRDHAFPLIGNKPVSDIFTADILAVLTPIWLSKHETAKRVRQRIRAVLEWTAVAGYRDGVNPADTVSSGLPRPPRQERHHEAVPYEEVPELVQTIRQSSSSEIIQLALEFLILTAARTGEVIGARWSEIDFDNESWTIPTARMRKGVPREHRVPLSLRCVEILHELRELRPKGVLIFPGRRGEPMSNMAMAMFMRRLGRSETVHGFRSSFRDWAAETTTYPREVCEAALAHLVESKVERAYRRSDLFEKRRRLMEQWERFVTGRMTHLS
jgi:integrase